MLTIDSIAKRYGKLPHEILCCSVDMLGIDIAVARIAIEYEIQAQKRMLRGGEVGRKYRHSS